MENEVKFSEFAKSLPDQRLDTVEITDIGNIRKVGKKDCMPIDCVDKSGKESKGILVPIDDPELTFNKTTFELKGGRFSQSGKSLSSPDYDWEIEGGVGTMTAIKELTGTEEAVEA